jgi:chemotaxis protein MotB
MRQKKHSAEHDNTERWLLTYADMITLLVAFFIMLYAMSVMSKQKFEILALSVRSGFDGNNKIQAVQLNPGLGVALSNALISPEHIAKEDWHVKGHNHNNSDTHQSKKESDENANAIADEMLANATKSAGGRQASGLVVSGNRKAAGPKNARNTNPFDQENMDMVRRKIEEVARERGIIGMLEVSQDQRGLIIRILTDKLLFDKGDGRLRRDSCWLLDAVSSAVKSIPNDIAIEGHTDDLPIHTPQYPSNWELSTARATNVLRYMVEHDGVPADRVSASGYAYTRPILPNTSEANRSRNRRVDIVVFRSGGDDDGSDGATGDGGGDE